MKLSLEEYFNPLKYYDFFDELFYYEVNNKEKIISDLGIKFSTYRVLKSRKQIDSDTINKLSLYFNINKIDQSEQRKHEILISRIYYEAYYKQMNSLIKLLDELEVYITKNNYLKPILVLMKVYGYLNLEKRISELNILKPELEYLSKFRGKYFNGHFKLFQQAILYFFGYKIDAIKLKALASDNEKYSWFYYNLLGSYYYHKGKDNEAILYYYESLMQYQATHNEIREINVRSNIACIYNILGNYSMSLRYTSQVLEYAYSSKNELYVSYLTQHYLYAMYMLNKKEEIKDFVDILVFDKQKLNIVSAVICILTLYKIDYETSKELIDIFNYDNDVKLIEIYLGNNDKNILSGITKTPYLNKLVEHLITNKHCK